LGRTKKVRYRTFPPPRCLLKRRRVRLGRKEVGLPKNCKEVTKEGVFGKKKGERNLFHEGLLHPCRRARITSRESGKGRKAPERKNNGLVGTLGDFYRMLLSINLRGPCDSLGRKKIYWNLRKRGLGERRGN